MKTSLLRCAAVPAAAVLLSAVGCHATAAPGSQPVEARLAWAPMTFFFLIFGVGVVTALASAARRRAAGGSMFGLLLGLVILGPLLLLGIFGISYVSAPRLAPPTMVYVQPPVPPPVPAAPLPWSAAPQGMTRILGPDEVPPAGAAVPVEASRPSPEAAASDPSKALEGPPEWVAEGTTRKGDKTFVVVSGQQYADAATARRDAIGTVAEAVRSHFALPYHPVFDHWYVDPNAVRAIAVRDEYTEAIRRSAGQNEFTVYRTHLRVEISPAVREAVGKIWEQKISTERARTAGGVFAFLTAIAAVAAGYFRLDDRTSGRYRWRLRLGSAAAVALAFGLVCAATAAVPIDYHPVPVIPLPLDAPADPAAPPEAHPGLAPPPSGDMPQAFVAPPHPAPWQVAADSRLQRFAGRGCRR